MKVPAYNSHVVNVRDDIKLPSALKLSSPNYVPGHEIGTFVFPGQYAPPGQRSSKDEPVGQYVPALQGTP